MRDFAQAENAQAKRTKKRRKRGGGMMKILKPLIFIVCLVVVFAVGYSLAPGKLETVDNTDELTRLQTQLNKKNQALESLQASLNSLKSEQVAMKQSMQEANTRHEAAITSAAQDRYAGSTDVGELNFYNDLPKQKVEPEPLQADPKRLAAATSASVTAIALNSQKHTLSQKSHSKKDNGSAKAAAGTSSKPLTASQVRTPAVKKAEHHSTAKSRPLPARYIPPGFERGKIPAPKTSKDVKKTAHSNATFMIQMGSFKSNDATSKLRKQLRKLGYTVHVKKAEVKGKSVFRVMVGAYHSGAKAKAAQASLKKTMKITGLIIKNK